MKIIEIIRSQILPPVCQFISFPVSFLVLLAECAGRCVKCSEGFWCYLLQGLYPESHGIIDNLMYDTEIKDVFTLAGKSKFDPRWWHGEPVSSTQLRYRGQATYGGHTHTNTHTPTHQGRI